MANMTFKANLLPNSDLGYSLGSSDKKWTVYGAFKGNADTATALTSNAGSSTVPIYFSNGKPVQCSTTLGVSITGNAATATKATQDGSGNVITSKYVTIDTEQTINTHKIFYTNTAGSSAYSSGSAIQIREVGNVANTQSDWTYAPKIGFHWGNRYQGVLGLHSNGEFYFGLSNGTSNVTVNAGTLRANSGLLSSTANGNTVTIGSQNSSFCHIYNSASIPFIFNKRVETVEGFKIYNNETSLGGGTLELVGNTPYIDFHYNNSSADFTSRIISDANGELYISGKLKINTSRNNYALNTSSFICDSWIRTCGETGWYNESYGGGWWMTDNTWIRNFNDKYTFLNNHLMISNKNAGNAYNDLGSAIEIREVAECGSSQSAWEYAPKIGFHWGGRAACQLGMDAGQNLRLFHNNSQSGGTFIAGAVWGQFIMTMLKCVMFQKHNTI